MKKLIVSLISAAAIFSLFACAPQQELIVTEIWARPGIAAGNSGVYFIIDNAAGQDDRLVGASSAIAEAAEIHRTTMIDEVMQMSPQEFVDLPAGEQVVFQPGDMHIMLINLHDQLNVGDSFELTLVFEKAGEISLSVSVQEP